MSYIDDLMNYCLITKQTLPIKMFQFKNTDDLNFLQAYKHNKVIYVIELIEANPEQVFAQAKAFHAINTHFACAKINHPAKILYVGSCRQHFARRMLQHFTEQYPSTYGLHLNQWYQGQVVVRCAVYADEVLPAVLQLLEDDLSHQLNPAFGKKGANNK